MENVERRVWREARAGSGHQAITRRLSWVQAAEILGISPRHMRRVRRAVEEHGMEAVLDQRGGRPRRRRIKAATIAVMPAQARCLCGLFGAALLRAGHRKAPGQGLLQLAAADVAGSRGGGEGTGTGQVSAPAGAPPAGRNAGASGRLDPPMDRGTADAGPLSSICRDLAASRGFANLDLRVQSLASCRLDEMATFQPSPLFYESAASQRFAAGITRRLPALLAH